MEAEKDLVTTPVAYIKQGVVITKDAWQPQFPQGSLWVSYYFNMCKEERMNIMKIKSNKVSIV